MTESFGCRPSLAMRNAVQLQNKAYLDHLHHTTLANLTGNLPRLNMHAMLACMHL